MDPKQFFYAICVLPWLTYLATASPGPQGYVTGLGYPGLGTSQRQILVHSVMYLGWGTLAQVLGNGTGVCTWAGVPWLRYLATGNPGPQMYATGLEYPGLSTWQLNVVHRAMYLGWGTLA